MDIVPLACEDAILSVPFKVLPLFPCPSKINGRFHHDSKKSLTFMVVWVQGRRVAT